MNKKEWQEEFADIDKHSYLFESKNPVVKWIHTKRHDLIIEMIKKIKPRKILEIGAGDGYFAKKLLDLGIKSEVWGLEISKKRIKRALKKVKTGNFIQGDAVSIPMKDNSFDLVIASEILEHISEYKAAMNEIKRVAKKGGDIIISFPNERNWTIGRLVLLRFPIHFPDHVNSLNPTEFTEFFGRAEEAKALPIQRLPFQLALTYIQRFKKEDN